MDRVDRDAGDRLNGRAGHGDRNPSRGGSQRVGRALHGAVREADPQYVRVNLHIRDRVNVRRKGSNEAEAHPTIGAAEELGTRAEPNARRGDHEDVTAHGTTATIRIDGVPPGTRWPPECRPVVTTVVGKDGATVV